MSLHPVPSPPATPGAPLVALRVSVRCDSVAAFSERYWRLVKDDRILLVANRQRAAGTRIRFTITLSDGSDVLRGEGRVVRMRKTPRGAEWVELAFAPLDEPSQKLVSVLQALRSAHGQAPHNAAAGLEFEAGPTTPIDRDALDEFDERRPTDRIDREQLDRLLAAGGRPPPLPPVPSLPPPPLPLMLTPPPLPSDVALAALSPEGPLPGELPNEMIDEEDLEPFEEEWHVLPTGKVRKVTRGELEIAAAPSSTVEHEADLVVVGDLAPRAPLPEGRLEHRKSGRTVLLALGILLGLAVGVVLGGVWLRSGKALPPPVPASSPLDVTH